jgi:hypothetical protein
VLETNKYYENWGSTKRMLIKFPRQDGCAYMMLNDGFPWLILEWSQNEIAKNAAKYLTPKLPILLKKKRNICIRFFIGKNFLHQQEASGFM